MADNLLRIDYTPQITSTAGDSPFYCHRICYSYSPIADLGATCCLEDSTDSFVGVPKTFDIDLTSNSCSPALPDVNPDFGVTIYGYVQPCCYPDDSLVGRTAFSVTYVAIS